MRGEVSSSLVPFDQVGEGFSLICVSSFGRIPRKTIFGFGVYGAGSFSDQWNLCTDAAVFFP